MEKLLLTNSSKGANRQRALKTALNASVSHPLRSRNRALSPAQRAAKQKQPSVKKVVLPGIVYILVSYLYGKIMVMQIIAL